MQTLAWYVRRLRAMSPDELAWRARSAVRDRADRYRVAWHLYPHLKPGLSLAPSGPLQTRWCPVSLAAWSDLPAGDPAVAWRDRLLARADAIARHRFSFFDLDDVDVGHPVEWNRDHASGIATPLTFWSAIDYRDYRVTGDAKVVWEPNRHHHLVVLARAYRATGRVEYALAVVEQLESWMDQCPFGFGMNWRSPLELAVRLVNWVWAIDLIADAGILTPSLQERLLRTIHLHVWDVSRKYSRGSSANNHVIGEACGVFVATSYFSHLPDAARLCRESQALLAHEIRAQTYPSGATREQAFGYHLFVLQFFLVAGVVSRWSQHGFDAAYWEQLQRMFAFAAAMTDGGPPPSFGDGDDGYVLDLGNGPREVDALMNVGRRLFGASGLREAPAEAAETAFWLFGGPARSARVPSAPRPAPPALESVSFADAGWYLLQWGTAGSLDRVSVLFDCGELGFTSLAAHGHADALNFTVRAFGEDLLVDPGTYDYFSYPEWREYFRSTRAHNTATVDGLDQSELLGSFLWGRRAEARCREWTPRPGGGAVSGEHDGYSKLDDPVVCRRRLELDQKPRTLVIDDEIVARGRHHIALFFHLSSACDVTREGNRIDIDFPRGRAVLQIDDRLVVSVARAGTPREGGWVSSGYHRKAAAWTLAATCVNEGTGHLRSVLTIGTPR